MKIDYHIYHLQPNRSLNVHTTAERREGALLRMKLEDGSVGYTDCHPWPELGDLPLQTQLNRIKQRSPTTLAMCSLRFGQIDAKARKKHLPLLDANKIPSSHFLISDIMPWTEADVKNVRSHSYTHLKIKAGRNPELEADQLIKLFEHAPVKLRIDFNESLTYDQFLRFLDKIACLKSSIDFIEDPIPFHARQWEKIQNDGWTLACDRQALRANHHPRAAEVLVIKPAILQESEWKNWTNQRKIVTSYLDHPLGQMTAAFAAAVIDPDALDVHGLLSHHSYTPNTFSQKLADLGPAFKVPEGAGFGFESELAKLQWKPLI